MGIFFWKAVWFFIDLSKKDAMVWLGTEKQSFYSSLTCRRADSSPLLPFK